MALKVGIIGMGGMGTLHFKTVHAAGHAVTAICDNVPEKVTNRKPIAINIDTGDQKEMDLSALDKYTDYKKMLRKADIDVVVITTPTILHAEMAVAAFKAGKHVFSEKPIARTSAQARKAAAAAEKYGKCYMIGQVLRFFPEYLAIRDMLADGRYGKLRMGFFWRSGSGPAWAKHSWYADAAQSGGAALDLHIHDTDAIQWLFGVPQRVASQGTVTADGGIDYIWTRFDYDGGPLIMSEGGWVPGALPFDMGFRLAFETATVEYRMSDKAGMAVYPLGGPVEHPVLRTFGGGGYQEEMRYFLQCVQDGQAPRTVTPMDAARSLAIVEAECKSVALGRPVAVKAI